VITEIGEYQKAALETNWIIKGNIRSNFGLYWFTQLYDEEWSEHVQDFRKISMGSVHSQPKSCAIAFKAGTAQWAKPNYYIVDRIKWQDIYNKNGDWVITRLAVQGIIVDTNNKYKSNKNENKNIGTYNFLYQEVYQNITIKDNEIDVSNLDGNNNYPLMKEIINLRV